MCNCVFVHVCVFLCVCVCVCARARACACVCVYTALSHKKKTVQHSAINTREISRRGGRAGRNVRRGGGGEKRVSYQVPRVGREEGRETKETAHLRTDERMAKAEMRGWQRQEAFLYTGMEYIIHIESDT